MKTKKKAKSVLDQINELRERLDSAEDTYWFTIKADSRFKIGDRVKFSAHADRKGIPRHFGSGVRTGSVKRVDGFSIVVKLDKRKMPRSYHHSFFEVVK